MCCRISLCCNFGLHKVEGKVDKVRALCVYVCVWASDFEDNGWDDLEGAHTSRVIGLSLSYSHVTL